VRGALDRLAHCEAMHLVMGRLIDSWWDRMLQLALLVAAPTAHGLQHCLAAFRQALGGDSDPAACLRYWCRRSCTLRRVATQTWP
jgi:hypothetical protein